MSEVFLSSIHVQKVRHLRGFAIDLSKDKRRHLILTGKNGSGKTSLLNEMARFLQSILNKHYTSLSNWRNSVEQMRIQRAQMENISNISADRKERQLRDIDEQITQYTNLVDQYESGVRLELVNDTFLQDDFHEGKYIIAMFEAKRPIQMMQLPQGIKKVDLPLRCNINDRISREFIQYIVNLKADRSFAKDDNDIKTAAKVDEWFDNFLLHLQEIFEQPNLKFDFDRKNYNFTIKYPGRDDFDLTTLSDGYSAILAIVTELLLRMESHRTRIYDVQGIVLIDEIETHLHIELQKMILPFLIAFFPRIQFVVSTHSPFILSSSADAIVYDLEKNLRIEDNLTGYSYDGLVESYFDSDKYSLPIKDNLNRYETLAKQQSLSTAEQDEFDSLRRYLKSIPSTVSPELAVKFGQIELERRSNRDG